MNQAKSLKDIESSCENIYAGLGVLSFKSIFERERMFYMDELVNKNIKGGMMLGGDRLNNTIVVYCSTAFSFRFSEIKSS